MATFLGLHFLQAQLSCAVIHQLNICFMSSTLATPSPHLSDDKLPLHCDGRTSELSQWACLDWVLRISDVAAGISPGHVSLPNKVQHNVLHLYGRWTRKMCHTDRCELLGKWLARHKNPALFCYRMWTYLLEHQFINSSMCFNIPHKEVWPHGRSSATERDEKRCSTALIQSL